MKQLTQIVLSTLVVAGLAIAAVAGPATSTVGASGYDLVSYRSDKPVRGSGNHVAEHDGITYLFASEANRKAFEANPAKYLPAYGGYCAYGVAVGKKFVADPEVWEIVGGRLFLNLDDKVKGLWKEDVPGNIKKADAAWPKIESKLPSEL